MASKIRDENLLRRGIKTGEIIKKKISRIGCHKNLPCYKGYRGGGILRGKIFVHELKTWVKVLSPRGFEE
jgi:hypothetical protein